MNLKQDSKTTFYICKGCKNSVVIYIKVTTSVTCVRCGLKMEIK